MEKKTQRIKVARETLVQGAFDYFSKPFDVERLERIVAAAMLKRSGRAADG